MGADLFGSFAESTCAALVIATQGVAADSTTSNFLWYVGGWGAVIFPLLVSAASVVVCLMAGFVATHFYPVRKETNLLLAPKIQLIVTTIAMIPVTYGLAVGFLADSSVCPRTPLRDLWSLW